jgi:hypothetical protein
MATSTPLMLGAERGGKIGSETNMSGNALIKLRGSPHVPRAVTMLSPMG